MAREVVVIGAGMGGLSAAIHLRLLGHDVSVLEATDKVGGKAAGISIDGYKLDPGPSIILLVQIYEELFRLAGRRLSDYVTFRRLDPISRVYFGDEPPIDLPSSLEGCVEVLRQRDPADAAAFERLVLLHDEIRPHVEASVFKHPYDKPWQLLDSHLVAIGTKFDLRATYRQMVDRRFRSPMLRAFFYGFPSYGGQTYDAKAPGAFMIPYLMIRDGVFYPAGGVAAIPKALSCLAGELGVQVRTNRRIERVETRGNRLVAAIDSHGERHEAAAFVSNVDRITFGRMLGREPAVRPSLSYFTSHWGIHRKLEGLQHHTLLIPKEFEQGFEQLYRQRRFPENPIIYLNATSVEDQSTAPAGSTNLFAVVTSPACEAGIDWEAETPRYKATIRASLDRFGLGFTDDEVKFERIQSPPYFETVHGNYRGSLYGADESERLFGMFPATNVDEKYANLFYCGGSVQPGAGLPMVTLSGRFAATKANAYLKRN